MVSCFSPFAGAGIVCPPLGGGGNGGQMAGTGIRIDWLDVANVRIQEGRRTADDGITVFDVTAPFNVSFANLDTGIEAASTSYYLWLTGDSSAVLSTSPTSPVGVPGPKWLAGRVWNDAALDLKKFRSQVVGDMLDVYWEQAPQVLNEAAVQPTAFSPLNCSTSGSVPVDRVAGIYLTITTWANTATSSFALSMDGAATWLELFQFSTGEELQIATYLPTAGPTFWWKKANSTGAQHTIGTVQGFRFDRSGIVYS